MASDWSVQEIMSRPMAVRFLGISTGKLITSAQLTALEKQNYRLIKKNKRLGHAHVWISTGEVKSSVLLQH